MRRMYSKKELEDLIVEYAPKTTLDDLFGNGNVEYTEDGDIYINAVTVFEGGVEIADYIDFKEDSNISFIRAHVSGLTPAKCGFNVIELSGDSGTLTESQLASITPWTKIKIGTDYLSMCGNTSYKYLFNYANISVDEDSGTLDSYNISDLEIDKDTREWTLTTQSR